MVYCVVKNLDAPSYSSRQPKAKVIEIHADLNFLEAFIILILCYLEC